MKTILDCGHYESEEENNKFTAGYGLDRNGKTTCFSCCAEMDKEQMRKEGKICLYLTHNVIQGTLTNWPGSLSIFINCIKTGHHNMTGKRYDVWFFFENTKWHGVTFGDNTQICHCKRVKN